VKGKILSFPWVVTNDRCLCAPDRPRSTASAAQGRLELRRFPRVREGDDQPDKKPVRLRHARRDVAVLYATEFMYANAPGAQDGKVAIKQSQAARPLEW